MLTNIKKYLENNNKQHLLMGFLLSLGFGYGLSDNWLEFTKICVLIFAIVLTLWYAVTSYFKNLEVEENRTVELTRMLEESDRVITDQEGELKEQLQVIRDYENQLDIFATELPCTCGGKFVDVFFPPGVENETVCEKCGAKYKVAVSFDSILISEPLEEDVVGTISKI